MKDEQPNIQKDITSNITSFSHAYLFSVTSIEQSYNTVVNFAKKIICPYEYSDKSMCDKCNICYLIDKNNFDDLYVVNPDSISIKKEEINDLMNYFKTKSLRSNGRRVYIICGFERLREDVSNKILKFLEEPEENIYALLITENIEKILPTVISRCQIIKLNTHTENVQDTMITNMISFLSNITTKGLLAIAYVHNYWQDYLSDRELFENAFSILEKILTNEINIRYHNQIDNTYICQCLKEYDNHQVLIMLEKTSKHKRLIKKNINLNLLLDRYIIEITKG